MDVSADRLRQVVTSDDFSAIGAAVRAYTHDVHAALQKLSPAEAQPLLQDVLLLLESSRRSLLAARADLGDELRRLQRALAYRAQTTSEPIHTWNIEG